MAKVNFGHLIGKANRIFCMYYLARNVKYQEVHFSLYIVLTVEIESIVTRIRMDFKRFEKTISVFYDIDFLYFNLFSK